MNVIRKFLFGLSGVLILSFSLNSSSQAQTYSGTGDSIPDYDPAGISFFINVSGLTPSSIDTLNFGLESVCLSMTHTWIGDIKMWLVAPDGTRVALSLNNGDEGDGFDNTCFSSTGDSSVITGHSPFTGIYKPQEELGYINNGQNGNGLWEIFIADVGPADLGYLSSWAITFGSSPEKYKPYTSSDLPIVLISTGGQDIIDEPKVTVDMKIIYNGAGLRNNITDTNFDYQGKIGIELRGASSQYFPQASYGFETRDASGNNMDASLLGMPSEHDWVLYAPYQDKALMRNVFTYQLAREMGHYASRTRFCELVLDGKYQGIYVLMEKIKRDKNRVNISKLTSTDISGDDLTGGYIVKMDWVNGYAGEGWNSRYLSNNSTDSMFFQYHYPKDTLISLVQKDYIRGYIDSFETSLVGSNFTDPVNGYQKYIDLNSFIDYMLITEMSKNVDAYRASVFFYKDKDSKGGKLHAGPVWDYNFAWRNADFCGSDSSQGWEYDNLDCSPKLFWFDRLMQDPYFRDRLRCRWDSLRNTCLSYAHISNLIDSLSNVINESQQRHFEKWPVLDAYLYNPLPLPGSFAGEIANLKNYINDRLDWMDGNLSGACPVISGVYNAQENKFPVKVFPNPFTNSLSFEYSLAEPGNVVIRIYDIRGREVKILQNSVQPAGNHSLNWDGSDQTGSDLSASLYICSLQLDGKLVSRIKIVKN